MKPHVSTHKTEEVLGPGPGWNVVASNSHKHKLQFYESDNFLLDQLAQFVGGALGSGDSAIVFATNSHLRGLDERLADRGLDVPIVKTNDRLICAEASAALAEYSNSGWPDRSKFSEFVGSLVQRARAASRNTKPRVVAFGELVALLQASGRINEALAFEDLWNDLGRLHAFELLCAYPLNNFAYEHDGANLLSVCDAHTEVFPAESYTALDDAKVRLRTIAELQQKSIALQNEAERRKRVQQLLRRREADLSDFLENALEGIVQIGADGRVEWANRAMLDMLGLAADDCVGQTFGQYFTEPARFDLFWRRMNSRESVYDLAVELRNTGGVNRSVLIHATGTWERDRLVHARCFVHDNTDRALMARALEERNVELREALAARDEFLSIAAHELKTPITGIRGYAQLLARDLRRGREISDQRLTAALQTIDFETSKLTRLVTRLLDASDARNGLLTIERRPVDIAGLARKVAAQQTTLVAHRIEVLAPERLVIPVDPERIQQVISNLLDNAVRFSPRGGRITLALEHEPGLVRISVTDNGVGVPAEQRAHLFDAFGQTAAHQHLSGLGIGLFLANEIVIRHGGRIEIEDPEQGGARFVVFLPENSAEVDPQSS